MSTLLLNDFTFLHIFLLSFKCLASLQIILLTFKYFLLSSKHFWLFFKYFFVFLRIFLFPFKKFCLGSIFLLSFKHFYTLTSTAFLWNLFLFAFFFHLFYLCFPSVKDLFKARYVQDRGGYDKFSCVECSDLAQAH